MRSRVFALVGVCVRRNGRWPQATRDSSRLNRRQPRPAAGAPAGPRTTPVQPVTSRTAAAQAAVQPDALVKQYCVTCHNQRLKTGDLALDGSGLSNIPAAAETWEKVTRKVRAGQMPPAGVPRPAQADLTDLVAHVETAIDRAAIGHARRCAGRRSIA